MGVRGLEMEQNFLAPSGSVIFEGRHFKVIASPLTKILNKK